MKWLSKKVVIMGPPAAGKSSLIGQFVYQKFSEVYLTTIGLKIDKKSIEVGDISLDMVLWEVAGQEKMIENYLRGCEGVIVVMDISRPELFDEIERIWTRLDVLVPNAKKCLVANKTDLLHPEVLDSHLQQLSTQPHYLSCAKNGENVETCFLDLAKLMLS